LTNENKINDKLQFRGDECMNCVQAKQYSKDGSVRTRQMENMPTVEIARKLGKINDSSYG